MISVGVPLGPGSSTCGYCAPSGQRSSAETNVRKAGLIASQLSCGAYQKLIDRGWRRSGSYCYAPDLRRSCCPQYTIRLDALAFKPTRSHRKLVNRWNRFVRQGDLEDTVDKGNQKGSQAFCLVSALHSLERAFLSAGETARHDSQVTLEPPSYTDEKYALFVAYQTQVHKDEDNTPRSFRRFLVQSPLVREPIPYSAPPPTHLPTHYGSYHQMYRVDGKLIAVGVVDVLPGCVSSVYFMYDVRWERHSLGRLSALREAALAREIHDAGVPSVDALYMGFYIHSCQKMRYKADYAPSFLADPEDFTWHPLQDCAPLLDKYHYATFSQPEHSLMRPDDTKDTGVKDEVALANGARSLYSIQDHAVSLIPVTMSMGWKDDYTREEIVGCIRALGPELSREIIFRM